MIKSTVSGFNLITFCLVLLQVSELEYPIVIGGLLVDVVNGKTRVL